MITSDFIALYGAGLSTLILIWQIIEKVNESKGQITVKMYPKVIALTYATHVGEWEPQLGFTITNRGKSSRYIETSPRLEAHIPNQQNQYLSLISPKPYIRIDYPKILVLGETIEPFYSLTPILSELVKNKVTKVRGFVKDTLGRTYHSEWIKIQTLVDYTQTVNKG